MRIRSYAVLTRMKVLKGLIRTEFSFLKELKNEAHNVLLANL